MTEILTESFCERCGTRYTFEPVVNRRKPLTAIGTLGRGIRHFVSDPGSSLDEAMAVARSESEQRSTASALEAFHRTFNFCLSCRQYTCADCWNVVEGRCLSCAPTPDAAPPVTRVDTAIALPLMDIAATPPPMHIHDSVEPGAVDPAVAEAAAQAEADAAALAEGDARVAAAAAVAEAEAAAVAEAEAAAQAHEAAEAAAAEAAEAAARAAEAQAANELAARDAADAVAEAEAQAAQAAAAEAEARRAAAVEAEAAALLAMAQAEAQAAAEAAEREAQAAAEREADEAAQREAAMAAVEADDPTLAFEPGLNLDDEIAAYERQLTSGEAPVEAEAEAGPAVAEPEPQLAVAEPDPIPDRAAASIEPIPTAIGQPIPASSIDGEVHWPDTQVAAAAFAPWQGAPEPASTHADDATPEATATRGAGLPAADARVLPMAARACPSCGLSLSASARFCRRCGTPQQVDAPG